ncbi:hypothetical protein PoB_006686400 [Plakobranchus ocellatus]|uniref:ShKT domain-containing protein n=1 Tax=Plakobranchus ocellatus TaxID=259542 RepID=A0AAV4D820_9GAST|nr:hypothetical protein PoB_006686400 [Plakobranchus ocellatus]
MIPDYPLVIFDSAVPTLHPLPPTTTALNSDPSATSKIPPTSTEAPPVTTLTPPQATKAPTKLTVAPPTNPPSTHPTPSAPQDLATPTLIPTPSPKPSFTTVAPPLGCFDKYDDCATQLFVCSSPYAGDICQKFCGLCPPTRKV